MFFKLFNRIVLCALFSNISASGTGIFPFSGTTNVHAINRGIWAVFDNPAGITDETTFTSGFSYHSRFLMQEVSAKAFAVIVPLKKAGNAGIGYQQFGYSLYKEQHASVVFARNFGSAVSAGLRFDYLATRFGGDYGSTSAITGSAGVLARITSSIRVGVSVFNPQRAKFSADGKERFPVIMLAGASWNFGGDTELGLGVVKSNSGKELLKCAIRYQAATKFLIHAAIANGAEPFTFGYIIKFSKFEIGMSSGYHQLLGFSPSFSLVYKN